MDIIRSFKIFIHDLFHPYNIVKIKNVGRHYEETDTRMFHAMFSILSDFVENEYIGSSSCGEIDINDMVAELMKDGFDPEMIKFELASAEEHNRVHKEILQLNYWYNVVRVTRDEIARQEWSYEKEKINEDENNLMLKRLIDIRRCLWT